MFATMALNYLNFEWQKTQNGFIYFTKFNLFLGGFFPIPSNNNINFSFVSKVMGYIGKIT